MAEQRAEAVPVCCGTTGVMVGGQYDGRRIPILHVDARSRPDVMDLPRAVPGGGPVGAVTIDWYFLTPAADPDIRGIVSAALTRPVACTFNIAIDARPLRPILQAVAEENLIGLSTVWPCPGTDGVAADCRLIFPTHSIEGLLAALAWTQEGSDD